MHQLALSAVISVYIYDEDDEYYYEIEDEHSDRATEAIDVASANAFAEKDAVMIVASDTYVTVFAMVSISIHINIALHTIQYLISFPIRICPRFILGLIIFTLLSCLEFLQSRIDSSRPLGQRALLFGGAFLVVSFFLGSVFFSVGV